MSHRAYLCATAVVVASSLLWLLLVAGIVIGPVQAQRGSAASMQVAATVSPQATPTQGQPAQQGKTVQNEQVPSWVMLSLLFIGCAVLLAVLAFMLWIGGLWPWHRQSQPAGWGYEVVLAILAALAAVVALAPQAFTFFTPSIGVRIVLVALAFVLALAAAVVRLWSTRQKNKRDWLLKVGELLNEPLGVDGQLPRLSALSPYRLGVSPSRYGNADRRGNDPYVARRIADNELDETLRSYRFVLIVGDSKAGKSRTAYEAARRLQQAGHDPRVLVPKSTDVLEQLLNLDPPLDLHPKPALLWLDNLTESELEVLTPALLDRLTAQMIVLGTMTAQRYEQVVRKDSDIGRTARLALQHRATKVIPLEADLTDQERAEAKQKYPQERFKAGIGEQLVAADELTRKYDNARQGANYHGGAVVRAAIDWMRMDVGRPIRQHELGALCPLYLQTHARHDDDDHKKALTWACEPVGSHIPLVEELLSDRGEPSYVPFDYLVAVADGQGGRLPQPILDAAWDKVLTLVPPLSPLEALNIGVSAYLRKLPLRAQNFFTAVAAEKSEWAPKAAFNLGVLLAEQGDLAGAKAAYQRAIDSGHAEWAPKAAVNLGWLLEKQGDLAGAKIAYQRAIDSGHPKWAPHAAVNLGWLLEKQGDLAGAKAAWQRAIDSGQRAIDSGLPEWTPMAAFNLGLLLAEQGDLAGAKIAYQRAIDSGLPEWAPMAAFNLGLLLAEQGDLAGAKAAWQRAIDSGHAEAAAEAAKNLGRLKSTPPPAAS